ncbi:hypothetical protein ACQZ46_23980, partial [Agrobacterium salinitolerans]
MGASITPENLTVRYATPPNSEPNLTTINRLVLIRARRYRVAVRMLTQGSEFHRLEAAPWSTPMNDLGCWFSRGTEPVFSPRSEPPLSMVFRSWFGQGIGI